MADIDFRNIAPRLGSQHEAFEELCCMLAHRTLPEDAWYTRLHGAGGDGGVECFADLPDGNRVGLQAKYVFEIGPLLTQATASLTTALKIHPRLTRYIVCFPFNLTGPTARLGRSGQEKFDEWRADHVEKAAEEGRQLTIEAWPASKILELLLQFDASGGCREFFFNQKILTNEWFSEHLQLAKGTAGPRYTPKLNVKTDLWKWFAAFGRSATWTNEFQAKLKACRQALHHTTSALRRSAPDQMAPAWPENSRPDAQTLVDDTQLLLLECDHLLTTEDPTEYKQSVSKIDTLLSRLESLESSLATELEAEHGRGKADSPGFRQFMAEYMVSFPAANLDSTRDLIAPLKDLQDWLCSPVCSLAYEKVFVLSGVAGSGKTHGICDAADKRINEGLLTCVTFGHEFRGEPDPWTRLRETLGLPVTLGMDGVLDALNAAGETSGTPLIICIDAINETRPLQYWHDRLSAFSQAIQYRPFLRLCITCRTSYLSFCLPDDHGIPIVEHTGFKGIERDACQAFFNYYGLTPPIAPILQPELSNPLYLRLVCESLRSRKLHRLPSGWLSIATTIRVFLEEKERQFAVEHAISPGANIVGGSLSAISRAIAESGKAALPWSDAQQVISAARPQAGTLPVLDWLVRADLLLEDAPVATDLSSEESVVRPAFERMGDFLVAAELLKRCEQGKLDIACQPGGQLHALLKDSDALIQNSGVLSALSILIPEQYPRVELPDLVGDTPVHSELVRMTIQSFPSRDPGAFTVASEFLIREALNLRDFSFDAMDALISASWQQSAIDAIWLDQLLKEIPLAKRDAFWCGYLHDRYESRGTVRRLIEAAFELSLNHLEEEIAERWVTLLLWFTAAADRRVKDTATRAAVDILTSKPKVLPNILQRLINCDDDEVRERALLICYGTLIISRDTDVIGRITAMLQEAYRQAPEKFDNALVRDHIRCISELAGLLNTLPEGCDPELTMQPINSEWPLDLPSEDQVKIWGKLCHFSPDEFFSDFIVYSMDCLRPWMHDFPKKNMGAWILQRIALDFGYEGSTCEHYDSYMLGKHGGGRAKPTWAERIGKKYQWIGMYQLASRLHDHIDREQSDWEPAPIKTPFILLEERKIDPTLPSQLAARAHNSDAWWIGDSANFYIGEKLSDSDWVNMEEDIPSIEKLLSTKEAGGQRWLLLVSYPAWDDRNEDAGFGQQYRQIWIHVESYLVAKEDVSLGFTCLHHRNFFGQWMNQGASFLYGFAGEYPWATSFNIDPPEIYSSGRHGQKLPVVYTPTWNELAVEWEYDASLRENFHMLVPARAFFSPSDLWWNGQDGYSTNNGKTLFRDISISECGPRALIADFDDLLERLDKLGLRLIWTIIGEKWILGVPHGKPKPQRTFSQIARLEEDGSVHIGDRVFFDDYDKDTGPSQ